MRISGSITLRLLNALNSEDRGLKVRFSLATIVFETFELILCQMLSSQGKNAPSNPDPSLFSAFSNLKVIDSPSDRSIFSTFAGGYRNTAIAEKREENPEILTNL